MSRVGKGRSGSISSGSHWRDSGIKTTVPEIRQAGLSLADILRMALAHHQAGEITKAELGYRQVLQFDPNHPHALHYLGLLAQRAGRHEQALSLLSRAIKINPTIATYYGNFGAVLLEQGNPEVAAAFFSKAIALNKDYAEAHNGLGSALNALGKPGEAVPCFHRALSLKPDFAEVHRNLGLASLLRGQLDEAVARFRKAALLNPGYAEAYNGLGSALQAQGNLDEAVENFNKAVALKPDYAEAHSNLGSALNALGRFEEAIARFTIAIGLKPEFAAAHNNLGITLNLLNRFDEALACYARALTLNPQYAEAYNNRGVTLQAKGDLDAAEASFSEAIHLKPDLADAFSNLIYLRAFMHDVPSTTQVAFAAGWEKSVLSKHDRTSARSQRFAFTPGAGQKLRLGIVSAQLGNHAVAYFLEPILEELERRRIQVTLYPTVMQSSARALRLQKLADQWTPLVGISDANAAAQIRHDRIDVLIDTTSHMSGCRLGIFARRAAPVQCHYIGHCGTSGLEEMDWFIADENLLPPSCDSHFRERIWRLPRLWLAYRGDPELPPTRWIPDTGKIVWLGSFNNIEKLRQDTCRLWAKVLNALPEAKLLLKDRRAEANPVRQRIRDQFAEYGIGSERIEFAGHTQDWIAHMAQYDRLDIALDSIPLNSGTTAFDALWMGVPMVSIEGDWMGGRLGSTILRALGKPEWVARGEDEFVATVAALAKDVDGRKGLRKHQRALMAASPLCDARSLARALEDAFAAMLNEWTLRSKTEKR